MEGSLFTRIITICSLKHKHVWQLTSPLLPRFIKADEFVVYVPEEELDTFLLITDPHILVRSQNELGFNYRNFLRLKMIENNNLARYGWYLQQFFKIEALLTPGADLLVIWDADCVPVKQIDLFDDTHTPIYMNASDEYNPIYFEVIMKLLGIKRIQNQTFVIPGFPMLRKWVDDFIKHIESRNPSLSWQEAIIECVDFSLKSGFSETETLGTWIANTYPKSWKSKDLVWERSGQRKFGYAKNFTTNNLIEIGLENGIDIISFENWDVRGWRLTLVRIKNLANKLFNHK